MLVEKNLEIGTNLKLEGRRNEREKTEDGAMQSNIRNYKVVEVYSHHVLLKDAVCGTKRCITNAELYQKGLVFPKQK